jgi:hypothetical protein
MKPRQTISIVQLHTMPPAVKQMLENKKIMQAYAKGELSKEELNARGIELINPLRILR